MNKKKKYSRLVEVPKVERGAYNDDRFISSLVRTQLIHLSTVEQSLPEEHRTGTNISTLHTERDAADYIGRVTVKLHELKTRRGKKTGKKRSARGRSVNKKSRTNQRRSKGKKK